MAEEELKEAEKTEEGLSEEEQMAAMMEAGDDAETLSQDEIDSLLGFDSSASMATTGIQALLERSQENYERLPMLEVVFDRYVRTLSTTLRNFTNENVEVNIESITSMRFEDYLNSVPLPALMAIFQCVEWENYGLITIDSALTYSMVDILLGGGKLKRATRVEGRPFTTIEQDMIRSLGKQMLEEMSGAFNPLTPATFRLERLETNPRFATITRPANPVILISLRIEMEERGGKAEIMFPYATLEPVKELLVQMFAGESFGGTDMSWEEHLSKEVSSSKVSVSAVLSRKRITLKDLASFEVGSTLMMNDQPNDPLSITCKGIHMMKGHLGAAGKHLAVQVEEVSAKGVKNGIAQSL